MWCSLIQWFSGMFSSFEYLPRFSFHAFNVLMFVTVSHLTSDLIFSQPPHYILLPQFCFLKAEWPQSGKFYEESPHF
uniref:Uncharacterized protein n=1 Tax=Anguilla anguilla TaxID=7936 RepID=A0A0E9WLZ8_ANGAN